jgi:membrane protein YdbS with pleckstrin-like domain
MVSLGVLTVALGGWKAAIALIPILAIHVAVALVVIPLWVRYRRRRKATRATDGD